MEKISISAFFPCYNEEKNVEKLLTKAAQFLPTIAYDYEIIVVDDGSSDATTEIARNFLRENPKVKIIRHETNMGYGAALRTGFDNSEKEYIFFTDGDNQFDIREIVKLLPYIKDFDIVAGFRIKRRDNFIRRLNAKCFNLLVRLLFGLKVKDIDCAFKIFKRDVIGNLKLQSSGAFINAEFLIRATRRGYKIKEIGVSHYPRQWGTQTGASPRVVLRAFHELFKFKYKGYKEKNF